MKLLIFSSLFSVVLVNGFVTTVQASKPPSGDSDPSDRWNRTVDTSQIINPQSRR
jgi:hypothetical protein